MNLLSPTVEFMKNPDGLVIADVENSNKEIKKAKSELKVISSDKKMREEYQIRQDTIREETFALNSAKLDGIEIGAYNNKIETAKKMLLKNKDIDEIIEFTELSKDEIEKIRKTL